MNTAMKEAVRLVNATHPFLHPARRPAEGARIGRSSRFYSDAVPALLWADPTLAAMLKEYAALGERISRHMQADHDE